MRDPVTAPSGPQQPRRPGETALLPWSVRWLGTALTALSLLVLLYLAKRYSYNLFHSLAEGFSIVVAFGVFLVAWNSRAFARNEYLLFVGIAYLFVGAVDFLHLLAYRGMGVFQGADADLPTQLWLVGRYLETSALLIAPLLLGHRFRVRWAVAGYAALTGALLAAVLVVPVFPAAFVEGEGLTLFKKGSEYVLCALLLVALGLLWRKRKCFAPSVFRYLAAALVLKVAAELAFTLYTDPAGMANVIGHYLKIMSFYLVYKAIIETSLVRPYDLLFREITQSEASVRQVLGQMEHLADMSQLAMSSLELSPLIDRVLPRMLEVTQADAAVILLRDERGRLVRRAAIGLADGADRPPSPVRMGEGFDGRVATENTTLYLRDAQAEPHGVDPLLVEGGLHTVVGVPLRAHEGVLGVLDLGWRTTRPRDERILRFLELLGDRVAVALDNARQFEEQRAVGAALQEAILVVPESIPGIQFGHLYRSASRSARVGGDFYDLFRLSADKVGLLLGDVAGHGLEAATTASFVREIVRAYAMDSTRPEVVLERANRVVLRRFGLPVYATVLFAILELRSGRLDYCSAGHPPALLRRERGGIEALDLPNLPLGALEVVRYRADWTTLAPGDQLLLYTDGLVEARRGTDLFGEDRLRRAFRAFRDPVRDLPTALLALAEHHAGGELMDDIAILTVALQPSDLRPPCEEPLVVEGEKA